MFDRLSPKGLAWLLGLLALALFAFAFISLAGSAVVVDETGGVRSAVLTTGHGREQALHKLWTGYFYAIPSLEGTIEVRCANGVRKQWGYVTPHLHTKIRVIGDAPCARVVHAD